MLITAKSQRVRHLHTYMYTQFCDMHHVRDEYFTLYFILATLHCFSFCISVDT